jgi:thiol-disulfide isomerase/thioredoxin
MKGESGDQVMGILRTGLMVMLVWGAQVWAPATAAVAEGDARPAIEYTTIDGATIGPETHAGKVVLTVFWATWCPVCMRELPEFERLHQAYREDGFEVVALSVDEDSAVVREYLQRARLGFVVAMRTAELKSAWGPVQGTPLLFLSDRSGQVRVRHLGAADNVLLEQDIKRLLQE